ncbi:MAG: hypothetical protein NC115_05875 [Bacteroidales bacterium]|nr:hypothetical protein [Bacteroidales bacterium]
MTTNQTLGGIPRDCATSMGGIVEALIANYDDVKGVTVADGQISTITMMTSTKFKRYCFRKGTRSMTSTLNVDAANGVNYVSTELALQFSRMETSKRVEMTALSINDLAIIVKDANGKYWYLGKDEPVTASAGGAQTGTARTDANNYTLTLMDNAQTFPYEVDASIVEDLIG